MNQTNAINVACFNVVNVDGSGFLHVKKNYDETEDRIFILKYLRTLENSIVELPRIYFS